MEITLNLLVAALGLSFILESLPWLISPSSVRALLLSLTEVSDQSLRTLAGVLLLFGAILFWAATSF